MSRTVTVRSHQLDRVQSLSPTQLSIAQASLGYHLQSVPAASALADCLATVPDADQQSIAPRDALSALCAALDTVPGASDVLAHHGGDLGAARTVAADQQRSITEVDAALQSLCASTSEARHYIADAERSILAHELASALTDTGWSVRLAASDDASALHAFRDGQHLVALMPVEGETAIEVAGCDADHCGPLLADTFDLLRTRGIEMTVTGEDLHGDSRGGTLIEHAAREARRAGQTGSLEIGALGIARAAAGRPSAPRRATARQTPFAQRIGGQA
jgi:hypothetical protein